MSIAVTGIKPTGTPHLGNYLGLIRPALDLAKDNQAYYFIADYHALTTLKDPRVLQDVTYEVAATLMSLGLDPEKATLYRQSDIPEICELTWILSCVTPKGLLNRAHAYKTAVDANREAGRDLDANVNAGLFGYPVLMAADVLLLSADVVPVGLDQKQHVEIARDIAKTFNSIYGQILSEPEPLLDERAQTIPGLDGRKMSKSYGNVVPIISSPDDLRGAVMRIVTDSRSPEEPKDPSDDLVFRLFSLVADGEKVEAMRGRYLRGGIGYAEAKEQLVAQLNETFGLARARYEELIDDRAGIDQILLDGADAARKRASPLLASVQTAVLGRTSKGSS